METSASTTSLRIRHAREALARAGVLQGAKDTRITVRVQERLIDAARRHTGIVSESELVTAGLSLLAAPEDFGAWLLGQRGALSDDFDIGL
jgi:hypothetical protein